MHKHLSQIADNSPDINKTQGFTLVELAIVIVIIGLIVSGVVAGKDLVKASQIRTIYHDITQFQTAISTFKLKYGYYPGDFPEASSYWGTDCAAVATNCDGDGNRAMAWNVEGVKAWQHLGLAGLIDFRYSGSWDFSGTHSNSTVFVGTEVPASKFDNAGYHFATIKFIEIGAEHSGDRPVTNMFTGQEAYSIDIKVDDGVATTGKVLGNVYGYTTTTGGSWSTASCISGTAYLLANTATNSCRLGFVV